jgi:NADPH:quinone reductase-like Zn-dependent oxidoreductase
MKDVAQLIANLNPDQRAVFLQKLRSGKRMPAPDGETPADVPLANEGRDEEAAPAENDNFYYAMSKESSFNSFVLRKKELTAPAPGHLQIKVKAASLNFRDLMIAMNMYHATPGVPSVMGSDYSGIVTAVGRDVKEFNIGDEVFCLSAGSLHNDGTLDEDSHFAAYTNIKPNQVTRKPANISWEEAACIPTAFLTSYFALNYIAKLKIGEQVLIHTASGGVGLSAIQIARWLGARIFVTAGTDLKREYLRSLGFENPMSSRTADFGKEILERTQGEGVDVILNTLAGDLGLEGLKILKNFGRFLQIDKKDIAQHNCVPLTEFRKGLSYSAIDLGLFYLHPELMKKQLDEISQHYENGNFKPLNYMEYPIQHLAKALSHLSRAQHIGKIVLKY